MNIYLFLIPFILSFAEMVGHNSRRDIIKFLAKIVRALNFYELGLHKFTACSDSRF